MVKAPPAGTPSPPIGPAGGDLSGTYPNPTVARIRGALLGTTTATSGHLLIADGAAWQSVALSGDATVVASGALTLANTAVTPGTYGDGTHVGQFTVDSKGRLTFAQNVAITGSSPTPFPLTETDDTNVTLTLTGSPTVALLAAVNIAAGWTGTLSIARGGTGAGTATAAFNNLSPLTTQGDLLTHTLLSNVRLAIGNPNDLLLTDGSLPLWAAMSGDATILSTGALTLANTAVTPATYGDATHVGQFTVDSKGRLTFAQNVLITSTGSGLTPVQFMVSFGATPTWEVTVGITDAGMTTGKSVFIQASLTDNTGQNPANAFAEGGFATFVEEAWVGGGFNVRVVALQGPVVGDYWFSYVII
jgi:hypothetical protein